MNLLRKIDTYFDISARGSNLKTEFIAALTIYLSMSYIIFVNPLILSNAGMDKDAVFTATIVSTIIATLMMGLIANLPFALAPGMGTNAWFAFGIVISMGYSWQQALAAVFVAGIIMFLTSLTSLRRIIIDSIPNNLKYGIGTGVGLFLMMLGFHSAGIIVSSEATIVTLGDVKSPAFIITFISLILMVIMDKFKFRAGPVLIVALIALYSVYVGDTSYTGFFDTPPSISKNLFAFDFNKVFEASFLMLIVALFISDFLDSTGVFIGIMSKVENEIPKKDLNKALNIDGLATMAGASLGTSTVTAYTESAIGIIDSKGRTGLVCVFIAIFFALSLFIYPILTSIPAYASAPILIYIGLAIFNSVAKITWDDVHTNLPTFLAIVLMPLTFSIIHGLGISFLTYFILTIFSKRVNLQQKSIFGCISIGYLFYLF